MVVAEEATLEVAVVAGSSAEAGLEGEALMTEEVDVVVAAEASACTTEGVAIGVAVEASTMVGIGVVTWVAEAVAGVSITIWGETII